MERVKLLKELKIILYGNITGVGLIVIGIMMIACCNNTPANILSIIMMDIGGFLLGYSWGWIIELISKLKKVNRKSETF